MKIRPFTANDTELLYAICLQTGNNGKDARHLYNHTQLIGDIYVGPYLKYAAEFALILVDESDTPLGYCISAPDTYHFNKLLNLEWFPSLKKHYASIDSIPFTEHDTALLHIINNAIMSPIHLITHYPAHLHIDLMPQAQHKGFGKKLIQAQITLLQKNHIAGLYLQMSKNNTSAHNFYVKLGFTINQEYSNEDTITMTQKL